MKSIQLIKTIEDAFDGVEKPQTSLRQFVLIDQMLARTISDDEWKATGAQDHDEKWQDISDLEILECDCQLAHMQAEEFRYYLPVYMRYSVGELNDEISEILGFTVFALCPFRQEGELWQLSEYNLAQYKLLNDTQRKAVIEFLSAVLESEDTFDHEYAKRALEGYWAK